MRLICAALLVLVPSLALAEEYLLLRKGSQVKLYRVADDLTMTAVSARIIDLDLVPTPPVTPPTPPVEPPPTVPVSLTGVAKVAYESARQINRPDEARVLAGVYAETARQLEAGEVDATKAAANASQAIDTLLTIMSAKERWAPFRAAVAQYWTTSRPQDVPAVIADYKGLARGLEASAVGSAEDADFVANVATTLLAKERQSLAISPELIMQLLQAIRDRNYAAIIAIIVSLVLGGI